MCASPTEDEDADRSRSERKRLLSFGLSPKEKRGTAWGDADPGEKVLENGANHTTGGIPHRGTGAAKAVQQDHAELSFRHSQELPSQGQSRGRCLNVYKDALLRKWGNPEERENLRIRGAKGKRSQGGMGGEGGAAVQEMARHS